MRTYILKACAASLILLLTPFTSAYSQEMSDLEKGREFMYCGRLNMLLLQSQGNVDGDQEKYKQQQKNTYTKMLMTAGAYLPSDTLNSEFSTASARLAKEVNGAAETDKVEKGATGRLLKSRYEYCRRFEEVHVKDALAKFAAQAATRKAVPHANEK
jgi:hypothetical protein